MTPGLFTRRRFTASAVLGLVPGLAPAQAGEGFWTLLREGGCVLLMRHAQTGPGGGDPPGFQLGDCGTQRNLSAAGREQARRIGAALVRERVQVDQVRSSAWCRCAETALLAFGRNTVWPSLNGFARGEGRDAQTRAVRAAVQGWMAPRNLALVTHDANITALTGEMPGMGEVLLLRRDPADTGAGLLDVLARQTF